MLCYVISYSEQDKKISMSSTNKFSFSEKNVIFQVKETRFENLLLHFSGFMTHGISTMALNLN